MNTMVVVVVVVYVTLLLMTLMMTMKMAMVLLMVVVCDASVQGSNLQHVSNDANGQTPCSDGAMVLGGESKDLSAIQPQNGPVVLQVLHASV